MTMGGNSPRRQAKYSRSLKQYPPIVSGFVLGSGSLKESFGVVMSPP